MPEINNNNNSPDFVHSEEIQDIVTIVPSWLIRWGAAIFLSVLILFVGLSAFIQYPEIVSASMTVDSPNSPKPIISKISGKIIRLLAKEGDVVRIGQPLAYIESTANHDKILALLKSLYSIQYSILHGERLTNSLESEYDTQLGEVQSAYQNFYQDYLSYNSSIENGFLQKKRVLLNLDLVGLNEEQQQLYSQKKIQQRDLLLANQEFEMHKKLEEERVETNAEFRQQESKYLAKKSPLITTESSIISEKNSYTEKEGEIMELNNQIQQEQGKFLQSVNSLISVIEDWKSKYIISSSQTGKLSYAGIIQENQILMANQEVFYVNPGSGQFFGVMTISQNNIGKVKIGQQVLIKLKGYPFEEYGMMRGEIKYLSDVPYKDSVFISTVTFERNSGSDLKKRVQLKQGMLANAEIITQNATILQRLGRSLIKMQN
jgi:multidrug efflux pump subunit AcrA (membrane-fusion protein)